MRILLTLLFVFCLIYACQSPQNPPVQQQEAVKGLWKLFSMEVKDSLGNWSAYRGGMQGFLLYDGNGSMALHLSTDGYENTDLEIKNFTDTIALEKLQYLTNFYGYMGQYRIIDSASIVEHTRISHSNPNDWGKTVQRRFAFSGDTLVITPVESANANLKLKWLPASK